MIENSKFLFEGNQITLSHTIFDVIVFDKELGRIIENPTLEQETKARLAKAEYLVEQKQIELVVEKEVKEVKK